MASNLEQELKELKQKMETFEQFIEDQKGWNKSVDEWRDQQIEAQKHDEQFKSAVLSFVEKANEIIQAFTTLRDLLKKVYKVLKPVILVITGLAGVLTAIYHFIIK